MKIEPGLLELPSMVKLSNGVKDMTIQSLAEIGLIPDEEVDRLKDRLMVVVYRKSWIERTWDKVRGKENADYRVQIVSTVLNPDL